jgi:hypothetical protein
MRIGGMSIVGIADRTCHSSAPDRNQFGRPNLRGPLVAGVGLESSCIEAPCVATEWVAQGREGNGTPDAQLRLVAYDVAVLRAGLVSGEGISR